MIEFSIRRRAWALTAPALVTIWTGCGASSPAARPIEPTQAPDTRTRVSQIGILEFLGEAVVPNDEHLEGIPVGGLSGVTYDEDGDLFYAISDDPASRGPARFYTLAIDLADGRLEPGDVEVRATTRLRDTDGSVFAEMTLDGEGLALTPEGTLYVSSEGQVKQGVAPFLREVALDGRHLTSFTVPARFLSRKGKRRGIRHNLGFESLTVAPGGRWFYSSTENALEQDGPEADIGVESPARLLRYDRATGRPVAEFVYNVEPVTAAPPAPGDFRTRGLVELIALDDGDLLALERSYTQGVGNAIDLYLVSLDGATNVNRWDSLEGRDYRPVRKTRLLELAVLGIELDNLEGMTLGPVLADGRRTLILVSDNNFSLDQRNQVLAFAIDPEPPTVGRIQSAGHRSQLDGAWVRGLRGTVTAPAARGVGFWLQDDGDGLPQTSDAILVQPAHEIEIVPGLRVTVDGLVRERGFPGALSVTGIESAVVIAGPAEQMPEPVILGAGGYPIPNGAIDDDRLEIFEPELDLIDFFESLEGMRVALPPSTVIGPTTRFGELTVVPDRQLELLSDRRSIASGLVATATDVNPERLLISIRNREDAPAVAVGDRLAQSVVGVLDYAFGTFRVLLDEVPETTPGDLEPETTRLSAGDGDLVIASYNVENLSARSGPEKYARVARAIVRNLRSPDILALQEVQDDSGSEDDGTVTAARTLHLLVDAIRSAGGPRYEFCQVDPEDLADGGQPGANIRVAYLFRPDRVGFAARGAPAATREVELLLDPRGPFLSPNPGRLDPDHPAFAADPARNKSGVRKALAAEFEFQGRRLFLVNLHLRSKRGDMPLFGSVQPPERTSEALRTVEARVISEFVDDLLELEPDAAVIVLGDFNEHPYREPVGVLLQAGLENLVESLPPGDRYTYIYRGNSQVLDNFLISPSLLKLDPKIDIVHMNADFPHDRRSSDHDPVLVLFRRLGSDAPSQDDS